MVAELVIAPEAGQDIADGYDWYEIRQVGLGEEFLSCVDACIERTLRSPEMYPIVHENYRRAVIRRFPYVAFYEFQDDTVIFYSIFHTSQDPDKWRHRLR